MKLDSGSFEGSYSYPSRFEDGKGTNPEELLGAAYAGCFSMALSSALGRAGYNPIKIETQAAVHLQKLEAEYTIVRIDLKTEAQVADINEEKFLEIANGAKKNCPISRALEVPVMNLEAKLLSSSVS
jgi:osmotically inducible protein OsmC